MGAMDLSIWFCNLVSMYFIIKIYNEIKRK